MPASDANQLLVIVAVMSGTWPALTKFVCLTVSIGREIRGEVGYLLVVGFPFRVVIVDAGLPTA